eukprot:s475_g8.t1
MTPAVQSALMQQLAHMTFENPGNLCFANATVQSFLWTTLALTFHDDGTWGRQRMMLREFFQKHTDTPVNLANERWFEAVVRCWGHLDLECDPSQITQQDSAEFVTAWLTYMHTAAFDLTWEKRFEENGQIIVADHSTIRFAPIVLQFDQFHSSLHSMDLTSLFVLWRQAQGMQSALLHASPCLCIQLDRLPSLIAQARPVTWVLNNDWAQPEPLWRLEPWVLRGASMYWMVRTDCLHLVHFHLRALTSASAGDPAADILALLPQPAA